MKLVIIEPLGVEKEKLLSMAESVFQGRLEVVYYDDRTTQEHELIERGKDADIIIEANLPLSEKVIEGFEKCKLISVAFTGVDHIAMEKAKEKGIMVCNCSGYSNAAVSELVFGLLIEIYRRIADCDKATRNDGTKDGLVGFELEGKKFGIVGTGAIGMHVAEIAKVFGCEVYAYSRTKKDIPWIKYVSLEELMSICDILTLHMPSNSETKHMINKDNIALMKKNAVLINCARGAVLDSQALADALNEGRIAGAGIDVFETEPPIPAAHPLLHSKNTVLTPHVAFATKESMIKRAVIVFDNVVKYMDGTPQNIMQ